MIETANMTNTGALAMSHAAHPGWAAELKSEPEQGANVEYYRAYYCALVTKSFKSMEHNRRLEAIKMGRRKERREKWLQSIRSLASVLSSMKVVN